MSKKCMLLWTEANFEVNMWKQTTCSRHFWTLRCRFVWQAQGIVHLVKSEQTWGFCNISKNDGRRGTLEEDLQRCIFCGRRSTKDRFMRDVRRSGRWFPERGCILEHQICRFAEMILPDRCRTSYDLASLFPGRRSNIDRWTWKIAQRIGTRPSALHATFHFWRKCRRIASFLMLSTLKNDAVSKNCFVFDLLSSKIEEASQNCFIFDVVKLKNWKSLAEYLGFDGWIDR